MTTTDLVPVYAALILADADLEITSDKILDLASAAGIELEPIWAVLLAKALEGKNVKELLQSVQLAAGAGGTSSSAIVAPEETIGETVEDAGDDDEEEEGDFGFDLFG